MKNDVPALSRALDIMELIAAKGQLPFGEICSALEIPTASAARILKQLCHRGYLQKDSESGIYQVGEAVNKLSASQSLSEILVKAAAPVLKQLRDQTSQTAILFYWNGIAWECIAKELHENSVTMQDVGEIRVDIFQYPWGVFAFRQLEKEKRRLSLTVDQDLPQLKKDREQYEKEGYVSYLNDFFNRFTVPLNDADGNLIGALALGITQPVMQKLGPAKVAEMIIVGGRQIEERMGKTEI